MLHADGIVRPSRPRKHIDVLTSVSEIRRHPLRECCILPCIIGPINDLMQYMLCQEVWVWVGGATLPSHVHRDSADATLAGGKVQPLPAINHSRHRVYSTSTYHHGRDTFSARRRVCTLSMLVDVSADRVGICRARGWRSEQVMR